MFTKTQPHCVRQLLRHYIWRRKPSESDGIYHLHGANGKPSCRRCSKEKQWKAAGKSSSSLKNARFYAQSSNTKPQARGTVKLTRCAINPQGRKLIHLTSRLFHSQQCRELDTANMDSQTIGLQGGNAPTMDQPKLQSLLHNSYLNLPCHGHLDSFKYNHQLMQWTFRCSPKQDNWMPRVTFLIWFL